VKSKHIFKIVAGAIAFSLFLSAGVGCKDSGPIKFFNDKPAWQEGWDAVFEAFTEKEGIDIKMTGFTDINAYQAAIKSGISIPKGLDIFTWWTNWKMKELVDPGFAVDLSSFYEPYKDQYPSGLLDCMRFDGKVYGVPLLVASWVMFYNKPVFEKYNLKEPQTWDEFIKLCDTLKANGVTPIGLTIAGGWTSFFWFQQLMVTTDPEAYDAVCKGEKSWESEEVKKTFEVWKGMLEKGYFSDPGIDLGAELPSMFAKGEVAMTYCGDWYLAFFDAAGLKPGVDYSMFAIPPVDPDLNSVVVYELGPIMMSENAENKEAAGKFIDFWLSPEGQSIWSNKMGFISPNAVVSKESLDPVRKKIAKDIWENKDVELKVRFWEATKAEISFGACEKFDKFVLNPNSYLKVMKELEEMAKGYWSK